MKKPLIQHLSSLLQQYKENEKRLDKNPNDKNARRWKGIAEDNLLYLAKNALPSGSGIDCGTQIALDASTEHKIVLHTSVHHMNDNGMYDGWTEHKVTVTPSFQSFDITISGRNRNDIKEYLEQVFDGALSEIWEQTADDNHPFVCPAYVEASRQFRFQCVTNELLQIAPDKLTAEHKQWIAEYKAFQAEQEIAAQSPTLVSKALRLKIVQTLDLYDNDIDSWLDPDNPEGMAEDIAKQNDIRELIAELRSAPLAKG